MRLLYLLLPVWLLFLPGGEKATAALPADFSKSTLFYGGDEGANAYRIPSIATAKDGSLLVFCEARRESWKDKSRTDVVMKRSTDNGQTWSAMLDLTKGTTGAYMDPTPIVDTVTGRVFLFATFWPADDHSAKSNKAILVTSDDNGQTWSDPQDVTSLLHLENRIIGGFGPGSGLQMQGDNHKGRLILPTRVGDPETKRSYDLAIYSDDHGTTWTVGGNGSNGGEFQIAESPRGTLIYNSRMRNGRMVSRSLDGGVSWDTAEKDATLPGVTKGCQASVLGNDNILYFAGIRGIAETPEWDERANLALYKSTNGGKTWDSGKLLYEKASGYTCMTFLSDGRIAIFFETADTQGFTRTAIPNTNPSKRPAGWMRLDLILINP